MALRIRVLSYNIHKGFSTGNLKFMLREVKESVHAVHADLVFLQEVLGHHQIHERKIKTWPSAAQFEFIAGDIWPHFAYGKNAVYSAGHHGNAILSKFPIVFWENIDVSTNKFESRGILHSIIDLPWPNPQLHVVCIHLALIESWRRNQVETLCRRIDSHVPRGCPLVVAGDFNDWRERVTSELSKQLGLREAFLEYRGRHARTYPIWLPLLKLDRIYCRGLEVQNARCLARGPWKTLSDHAALCVDFKA